MLTLNWEKESRETNINFIKNVKNSEYNLNDFFDFSKYCSDLKTEHCLKFNPLVDVKDREENKRNPVN